VPTMKAEKAGGYANFEAAAIRRLLRHPLAAIATHWAFQSLLYMDPTERWFKIGLDVVLGVAGSALLCIWLPWPVAWVVAFLAAHTLNFLCNGHLWGVLKHYGMVSNTYEAFHGYTRSFGARTQREPALQQVAIYGGLARQQWSPSSDLDVRIVRRPGLVNGLRACWFALRERSRAALARFPLDLYVLDNDTSLQKLNAEEKPIAIASLNDL